jgi:hypothetical protein
VHHRWHPERQDPHRRWRGARRWVWGGGSSHLAIHALLTVSATLPWPTRRSPPNSLSCSTPPSSTQSPLAGTATVWWRSAWTSSTSRKPQSAHSWGFFNWYYFYNDATMLLGSHLRLPSTSTRLPPLSRPSPSPMLRWGSPTATILGSISSWAATQRREAGKTIVAARVSGLPQATRSGATRGAALRTFFVT